jgi:hypothetical protein
VFCHPTTPADLIVDGRPTVLYCSQEALSGSQRPWRAPTERFIKAAVSYDYMRHPPFTYPRWLYEMLRTYCLQGHGVPIAQYIQSCPVRGFSEFNALGAYAHRHCAEYFDWIDVGEHAQSLRCMWYWSWGGLSAEIEREIAALLA